MGNSPRAICLVIAQIQRLDNSGELAVTVAHLLNLLKLNAEPDQT